MAYYDQQVEVLIDTPALQARVRELGEEITRDCAGAEVTLIAIMKGALFFVTDLARAIDLPVTLELMGVSSYRGTETTGEVRITHDVTRPMAGRHLIVVEDIIDTGLTMQFLLENLKARHPASVRVCTLLQKPSRARVAVHVDYKGFVIEDRFVVGYGLDHDEQYRNLPFVAVLRRP